MGGVRQRLSVPTLTLDSLLESQGRPDFVKVDVEGAERLVMEGVRRIPSECRPNFPIEVGSNERKHMSGVFSGDYRLFDAELPSGQREPILDCAFNTLAVPVERSAPVSHLS